MAETAVEVISEDVSPAEVEEGSALTFTVSVKGEAASVTLIDELGPASAGGDFTPNFANQMVQGSTTDGITTWTLNATASKLGRHRFYAVATAPDSSTVMAPGEAPTYLVTMVPVQAPQNSSQQTLSIVSQIGSPLSLNDGELISFLVRVNGGPESVVMNWGPTGGDANANQVLQLSRTTTEPDGATLWQGSMITDASSCFQMTNRCYYTAEAFASNNGQTTSVKFQNTGEWFFTVNP